MNMLPVLDDLTTILNQVQKHVGTEEAQELIAAGKAALDIVRQFELLRAEVGVQTTVTGSVG